MDNCLFCKIAAGQIPSTTLYEDDEVKVFNDINPAAAMHFLIIPKEHIATMSDAAEHHSALLGRMMLLAKRIAHEQGCGYQEDADGGKSGGYKILVNTGPDGRQEVYHLHIHVIGGPHPWKTSIFRA